MVERRSRAVKSNCRAANRCADELQCQSDVEMNGRRTGVSPNFKVAQEALQGRMAVI